jgi:hypothetical protein
MPYITDDKRKLYADEIQHFETFHAAEIPAGELNYFITSLLHAVIKKQGLKYDVLNKIIGVLRCVEISLNETVVIPYEKTKIVQNGCVSELDREYLEGLWNMLARKEAATEKAKYTPQQHQSLEDVR